jgi:hypothetical protein
MHASIPMSLRTLGLLQVEERADGVVVLGAARDGHLRVEVCWMYVGRCE